MGSLRDSGNARRLRQDSKGAKKTATMIFKAEQTVSILISIKMAKPTPSFIYLVVPLESAALVI
jgi:hypothetical protein